MADLESEFEHLIEAAQANRFEAALVETSLSGVEAFMHPLNFVAIKSVDGMGRELRLHLWNGRFHFGQGGYEVHNHIFDIDSFIVQGRVIHKVYAAVPDSFGAWEAYKVSYSSGGSELTNTNDRVTLKVLREEIHYEGDRYRLGHGILHTLVPATQAAATLVLTRPHGGTPISIGPAGSTPRLTTDRPLICDASGHPMTIASSGIANIVARACSK